MIDDPACQCIGSESQHLQPAVHIAETAGRAANLLVFPLLEQIWKVVSLNVRAKGLVYPSALFARSYMLCSDHPMEISIPYRPILLYPKGSCSANSFRSSNNKVNIYLSTLNPPTGYFSPVEKLRRARSLGSRGLCGVHCID